MYNLHAKLIGFLRGAVQRLRGLKVRLSAVHTLVIGLKLTEFRITFVPASCSMILICTSLYILRPACHCISLHFTCDCIRKSGNARTEHAFSHYSFDRRTITDRSFIPPFTVSGIVISGPHPSAQTYHLISYFLISLMLGTERRRLD